MFIPIELEDVYLFLPFESRFLYLTNIISYQSFILSILSYILSFLEHLLDLWTKSQKPTARRVARCLSLPTYPNCDPWDLWESLENPWGF